jgi:hypothetical protein
MATLPQPPSFDAHHASFESLPLLMSALLEDPASNVALTALQNLVHDGTPGRSVRVLYNVQAALTGITKRLRRTSKTRVMSISGISGKGV